MSRYRGLTIAAASNDDSWGPSAAAEVRKGTGGRRFRAVDAVAPLDDVEVELEDARLPQLGLEPPRDDQLAQLADRVLRRRQIQVLGQLLGDRAAAARPAAARPSSSSDSCSCAKSTPSCCQNASSSATRTARFRSRRNATVADPLLHSSRRFTLWRAPPRAQLHERGRRRIGCAGADVGQGEPGVGSGAEAEGQHGEDHAARSAQPAGRSPPARRRLQRAIGKFLYRHHWRGRARANGAGIEDTERARPARQVTNSGTEP